MRLPFTADQFFDVFRQYNEAVWPMQVVLTTLAILCVVLVAWPRSWSDTFVAAVLSFLWTWLAVVYHFLFFARINHLAYAFAAVSAFGAGVFLWFGVLQNTMRFAIRKGEVRTALGMVLVVYALAAYPLLSIVTGHPYPEMPTFGLPCPTTIFTSGMLTLMKSPSPRIVMIVPLLWCVVGVQAAFLLGVPHDLALGAAGLVGLWATRTRRRPD